MFRYPVVFQLMLILSMSVQGWAVPFHAPGGLKLPVRLVPTDSSGFIAVGGAEWSLADGQAGIVEYPAWWQDYYPPSGEMVVLELEYLDDFSQPVVAEIYSGLNVEEPYSEIHRFGGRDDSQWKRAVVPLSSGFMLKSLCGTLRVRLRSVSGGLRVRNLELRASVPGDEKNYNRESRDWVELVQRRAVVDSSYYKLAEPAVIPVGWADRAIVPFARNWMSLVLPVSAPGAGEVVDTFRVRMYLNEYEPLQLGVYANGKSLSGVEVFVDPISDAKGNELIGCTVRVAEYSKVMGWNIPDYFVEPFPQRLWPACPFDIEKGRSHLVLLDLHTTDGKSRAGTYTTKVRFRAEGVKEIVLPLTVEVMDQRLLTMQETGLHYGGYTIGMLPDFELPLLKEYNHNLGNIWYKSVRPDIIADGNGEFRLDFAQIDHYMEAALAAGFDRFVYFLGGNPYGFPYTMHLPRTLADKVLGLDEKAWKNFVESDPGNVPKEVAPLITEWARQFSEHAREKGWPEMILTPFDEPAKWQEYHRGRMMSFIKPQFRQQVALLRAGAPDCKIYGSIHMYGGGIDFLGDVDVYCTDAVHQNWNLPDEVCAAGKEYWEYTGTFDKGFPDLSRYTFGFYFASHNSRGAYAWAYNWGKRFDTLDGANWLYAWDTPFDLIPSPYLIGLREAYDDRRLLETIKLAAESKNEDITIFLGRLFADIAVARGSGGDDTVTNFWEMSADPTLMIEWKERMIEKLNYLGGVK